MTPLLNYRYLVLKKLFENQKITGYYKNSFRILINKQRKRTS